MTSLATERSPDAEFAPPPTAAVADVLRDLRLQLVSPRAEPPAGEGWLHEIKHDGHRLDSWQEPPLRARPKRTQ